MSNRSVVSGPLSVVLLKQPQQTNTSPTKVVFSSYKDYFDFFRIAKVKLCTKLLDGPTPLVPWPLGCAETLLGLLSGGGGGLALVLPRQPALPCQTRVLGCCVSVLKTRFEPGFKSWTSNILAGDSKQLS